jgi:hypothetical protein
MTKSESDASLCECKSTKAERLYTKYADVFGETKIWTELDKATKAKWFKVCNAKTDKKKKRNSLDGK